MNEQAIQEALSRTTLRCKCARIYFCPTSNNLECTRHSGFFICCDSPNRHVRIVRTADGLKEDVGTPETELVGATTEHGPVSSAAITLVASALAMLSFLSIAFVMASDSCPSGGGGKLFVPPQFRVSSADSERS